MKLEAVKSAQDFVQAKQNSLEFMGMKLPWAVESSSKSLSPPADNWKAPGDNMFLGTPPPSDKAALEDIGRSEL